MSKRFDIMVLLLYPLVAIVLIFLYKTNFLFSTLLYFGIPSLYLSLKAPNSLIRATFFSLIFAGVGGLVMDHLAVLDNEWYIPTIFPFKVFGTVPLEDIVWGFLLVYFIVMFYEHFFEKIKNQLLTLRSKYALAVVLLIFSFFLLLVAINAPFLQIAYFYLIGGTLFILLPSIVFLLAYPKYIIPFFKTALFFLYVNSLYELTGLLRGYWEFTGTHFIGSVMILHYKLPYEEIIFFLMFFAVGTLSYYKFFNDKTLKHK